MSAVQSAEPWAGQDICHYIPQWLTSVTFMAFRYSVWKILHLFSNICFKSSFLWFQLNDSLMSVSRYAYCCIAAYKSFSLPLGVFYNFKTCPSWGWDFVHFNFPFFDLNFITLTIHFRLKGPRRAPCSKLSGHYTTHNWVCIFVCVDPAITCISWTVPSLQLNHAVNTCHLSMAVCPLIGLSEVCTRVHFSLYVSVYICRVCLCLVRQW